MSHSASTPSAFKRVFVGADAAYAAQVPENDILHVAGPYGPILRVGSTTTEDYVIWTGTANTSFGELDVGANLANYFTISGAASGSPPTINAVGTTDANVGVGIVPKGDYMTTTTRMLIGPQASWAAAQTSNVTRLRTQLAAFATTFTQSSGDDLYPQFSVTGGTQGGTLDTGSRFAMNIISLDADNINVTGAGPSGASLLYLGLGVGNANGSAGGAHAGNRNALDAEIFVNSDIDVGSGANKFHVGVAGGTTALYKMGGVAGGPRGNVFGANLWARAINGSGPGTRYLNSLVGLEVGVLQAVNTSVLWRVGVQIVGEKTTVSSAAEAIQQNIALSIANQPSATTIGWDQAISVGAYNGQFSLKSNGQFLTTLPTPIGLTPYEAADGVNLERVTFSRAAFSSPGFYVDGSGNSGGQTVGGKSLQTVSAVNAKVSTVSSVTVIEGGSFDGGNPAPFPTFTIASPASSGGIAGVTATMTVATMGAANLSGISAGGNGLYVAGEVLTALGGTGTAFTVTIETVTAGVPVNVRVETAGSYTVLPTNPITFTGSAAGSGFAVGMQWKILTLNSGGSGGTVAGTNYNELTPPHVDYIGAMVQTKEARFKVVMSAGTLSVLGLNEGTNTAAGALTSFLRANQTLNGNVSTSTNVYVNNFNVADSANTTTGSGPAALNYFTINDVMGASATGGRNGLLSLMSLNGAMTNAANNLFYNAASFDANASYNQGGTATGSNYAKLVAFTGEASARAGATYINSVEGSEIGAGVRAGASAGFAHVLRISPLGYAGSRGAFWSYNGIVFAHGSISGTDGQGLDAAIGFGGTDGDAWPVARTGALLELQTPNTAPTNTVAWGVDFARGTFDGGAWRSPGFAISPIGTVGGVSVYGTALQTQSTIKAATAVVGSIAVTNGGAFDAIPALTISAPPLGGTTATATVASMKAARAFIDTQGSGYTNGDVLTVSGGTFGTAAQLTLTVSGGLITEINVTLAGSYTVLPANAVSTTGGTGTGAKFYMQWGINAVTVTLAGTNYPTFPAPFVSCSGEKSIKALFAVTMTETQAPLLLNAGSSTQVDSLTVNASGPTIRSGTGAASGTQPKGSVWMRTDGGVGTTMYVSQGGGTWNAVAGV